MIAGGSDTQLQNHEIFEYKTYMLSSWVTKLASLSIQQKLQHTEELAKTDPSFISGWIS